MLTGTGLIADELALGACLAGWPPETGIAVDTEFVRERTYYPKLCLIQVAAADRLALIDILAIEDAGPLALLLTGRQRPKLLHAARQDFEALLPLTGTPPAPVFDTQLAAALLGYPAQIGYADLVRKLLGVDLAKGHARTDWSRRPLSPAQLDYAADDVRYLPALAAMLGERLEQAGRSAWLEEDAAALVDPSLYRVDPADAWRRLKGVERLEPRAQSAIRSLASWREARAIDRNLPRGWVLPDPALFEIAQSRPRTREQLSRLSNVPRATVERAADAILAALEDRADAGQDRSAGQWTPLEPAQQRQFRSLQQKLAAIAAELGLQPEVLATRRDLTALVRGARNLPMLGGWRRQVVGEALLAAL